MAETLRYCAPCGADTWFEVVVLDDSPADVGELACADCGAGVWGDVLLVLVDEPVAARAA